MGVCLTVRQYVNGVCSWFHPGPPPFILVSRLRLAEGNGEMSDIFGSNELHGGSTRGDNCISLRDHFDARALRQFFSGFVHHKFELQQGRRVLSGAVMLSLVSPRRRRSANSAGWWCVVASFPADHDRGGRIRDTGCRCGAAEPMAAANSAAACRRWRALRCRGGALRRHAPVFLCLCVRAAVHPGTPDCGFPRWFAVAHAGGSLFCTHAEPGWVVCLCAWV